MNQRRAPRFETEQSVGVTLFGEPDIRINARIKNVSVRGIGLEFQGPVAIGTALKIDLDDGLLLGEVIYCRKDAASYYVGVELEQALCGLRELAQALRDFSDTPSLDRPSGPQQTHPVKERSYQN